MQFEEKSVGSEIRNQLTIEVNSEKHRTDNGIIIKLAICLELETMEKMFGMLRFHGEVQLRFYKVSSFLRRNFKNLKK